MCSVNSGSYRRRRRCRVQSRRVGEKGKWRQRGCVVKGRVQLSSWACFLPAFPKNACSAHTHTRTRTPGGSSWVRSEMTVGRLSLFTLAGLYKLICTLSATRHCCSTQLHCTTASTWCIMYIYLVDGFKPKSQRAVCTGSFLQLCVWWRVSTMNWLFINH